MPRRKIDRDRLRRLVRTYDEGDLLLLLERAIDLLPATKLPALIRDYADPAELMATPAERVPEDVLASVEVFYRDSLKGRYYDGFDVNSKNFMQKSRGTQIWISEYERLLTLVMGVGKTANPLRTRRAFELLFAILAELDKGTDRVLFFADEGGSWQVGVNWSQVIPAWSQTVAATAQPDEFAASVHSVIAAFAHWNAESLVEAVLEGADPQQREALSALPLPQRTPDPPLLGTLR